MVWRVLGGLLAACVVAVPAFAHHSFSAEFEADKTAELTGKIVQVWWNNPHIRYRLAVAGEGGAPENWELQASSITAMQQLGWSQATLKVGDELKVSGQVGRNGTKKLYVRSIERPDGTRLVTGRGDSSGPDPNEVHATPGKNYGYGAVRNNYPVDITGRWRNRYKFRVTVDDLEPKPTPFTAGRPRVCSPRPSTIRTPRCVASRSGCRACSARRTTWRSSTPARTTCSFTSSTTRRGASGWMADGRRPIRSRRRSVFRSAIGKATCSSSRRRISCLAGSTGPVCR